MQSLIYKIDDVLLLETLIKYGCIKVLTTFCCTDKYFYRIFKKNKDKYYKQLLYLRHISPFHFERFCKSDNNYIFDFNNYKIYTKFYSLVSNSDFCGCVNIKSIIHMKIPADHYKYTPKKGYRDDEEYTHQRQAVYYTFYPSNTELVISKFKNTLEKKLFDEDITDKDYFNNKIINYTSISNNNHCVSSNNKYLKKCGDL